MGLLLYCVAYLIELRKINVMQAKTAAEFPNPLDPIELRTVWRRKWSSTAGPQSFMTVAKGGINFDGSPVEAPKAAKKLALIEEVKLEPLQLAARGQEFIHCGLKES